MKRCEECQSFSGHFSTCSKSPKTTHPQGRIAYQNTISKQMDKFLSKMDKEETSGE